MSAVDLFGGGSDLSTLMSRDSWGKASRSKLPLGTSTPELDLHDLQLDILHAETSEASGIDVFVFLTEISDASGVDD